MARVIVFGKAICGRVSAQGRAAMQYEDVGSLAGSEDDYVSDVRDGVRGVDGDKCQIVIGQLEKELIIEYSVDYLKQVFPRAILS